MLDDLHAPIRAICPGCGEPSQDLLAHAPHCTTPEALEVRAGLEEELLQVKAAIREIEFTLTTMPAEEAVGYSSRLAELHADLHRLTASSIPHRRLLDVLRERGFLLDG
jgi:hypothetical protein